MRENKQSSPKQQLSAVAFIKDYLAGGISGSIIEAAKNPVNNIRNRWNVEVSKHNIPKERRYKHLVDIIFRNYAEEGQPQHQLPKEGRYQYLLDLIIRNHTRRHLMSFWRGVTYSMYSGWRSNSMLFAFKDLYQKILVGNAKEEGNKIRYYSGILASGGAAGGTNAFLLYPFEYINLRWYHQQHQKKSGLTAFLKHTRAMFREEGIATLYGGFSPALAYICVYRAAFFGGFDIGKELLFKDPENSSFFNLWMLSIAVVMSSKVIAQPIRVLKTGLMMESGRIENRRENTASRVLKIFKDNGPFRLFSPNMSPHQIVNVAFGSLLLVVYDKMKRLINSGA